MLYLLVALGIGLLISSATKSQFVASQVTMLVTFLPAMMLSGFLFDLRSMPAAVRVVTYILPARYYVALLQTIFLAGDVWEIIVPNAAVLACMAFADAVSGPQDDAEKTRLSWCAASGTIGDRVSKYQFRSPENRMLFPPPWQGGAGGVRRDGTSREELRCRIVPYWHVCRNGVKI